ncbi:hypothetical protein [Rufibacter latericius]|uniref:Uncharacterized protein n=1 Tax=Rufibacter latericius TaxID=2487040 RepID=A0A3M9MA62_9BACT|nr:hypothetical protein [Rufibacter latericius]RNI22047.1 hypothetical protein EFB08_23225 [Rufibacter latericius]
MEAAFGQGFTDKLTDCINSGKTSTVKALRMVSAEMTKTNLPADKLKTMIADVFGKLVVMPVLSTSKA